MSGRRGTDASLSGAILTSASEIWYNPKYHEAFEKGIGVYGASYANTMMVELGVRLNFARGSDRNIKLTTPGDIDIFKALLSVEKSG